MSGKLILRGKNSPYTGQFVDVNKGSVLSHANLDDNLIYLKGELIYTGTTSGTVVTFSKIDGSKINVDLAPLISSADNYTTGTTLVGTTVYFDRTDSLSGYTLDLSTFIDDTNTFVTGSTLSGSTNLVLTRNDNVEVIQDLSSFLDNTNDFVSGGTVVGSSMYLNRTDTLSGVTIDVSSLLGGGDNIYNNNGTILSGRTVGITDTLDFASGLLNLDNNSDTISVIGDVVIDGDEILNGDLFLDATIPSHIKWDEGIITRVDVSLATGTNDGVSGTTENDLYIGVFQTSGGGTGTGGSGTTNNNIVLGLLGDANFVVFKDDGNRFHDAYTFPIVDGTANQVLTTDGNGTLTFDTITGGQVNEVIGGTFIDVDNTDPAAPIINFTGETLFESGSGATSVKKTNLTNTATGPNSFSFGDGSAASGSYSIATGRNTKATAIYSHAQGNVTEANGDASFASGISSKANGEASHAVGKNGTASGIASHVEGDGCIASNSQAHAEGNGGTATGLQAHAEGLSCLASGDQSHAQGYVTRATALAAHSEGYVTQATGKGSHAGGSGNNNEKIIAAGHAAFAHFSYQINSPSTYGAHADFSAILGGSNNEIVALANNSGIFCGSGNTLNSLSLNSTIIGGDLNSIDSERCAIVGGSGNTIGDFTPDSAIISSVNCIVGGSGRTVAIACEGATVLEADTVYTPKLETLEHGEGIIMASPNGTRYKITITNGGVLSATTV